MLKIFKKRKDRKQIQQLREFTSVFSTLRQLEKSGLLMWNKRERRLFIAYDLAIVMMGSGKEHWMNFLNNTFLSLQNKELEDRWKSYILRRQAAAITAARQDKHDLNKTEIQGVKSSVLKEIEGDEVKSNKIEPFEFYIVDNDKTGEKDDDTPSILLVGTFNPDTEDLDMVDWNKLKDNFNLKPE